jgi:hypothetical protein
VAKKTLGKRMLIMRNLDKRIAAIEAQLKEVKQKRAKVEARMLKEFEKEDIDGMKLKGGGTARIRRATFFSISDRRKFDKYVLKHKALDLFQNRISANAYKARLEEGDSVPGVGKFERIGISISMRGAK